MHNVERANIDYRLLSRLSRVVLCSPCFRRGIHKPVPQLIGAGRKPRNLCNHCSAEMRARQ